MFANLLVAVISFAMCLNLGSAANISGTIVIEHRLTPRKVTPLASSYQRGVAVELGSDHQDDSLSFERTHIVVSLEGEPKVPPVTVTMEQQNRQFVPDLLMIPTGSTVSFPNQDPISHNVFSLSKDGEYTIVAWHKRSGFFRQPLQVPSYGPSEVQFLIPLDEHGRANTIALK